MSTKILYTGPFASLTLRLKRISITTAALSLSGVPLVILYKALFMPDMVDAHTVDVVMNSYSSYTLSKQAIVGGTAILAATGSTAALSYCFSSYVHSLEYLPTNDIQSSQIPPPMFIKATTRNIFGREIHTVFDVYRDVIPISPLVDTANTKTTFRPFCNFIAKGVPMYVHPELIYDPILRYTMLGEKEQEAYGGTDNKMDTGGSSHPPANKQTHFEKQYKDDDLL